MAAVQSGSVRMEGEAQIEGASPVESTAVIYGDYQTPDRSQFTLVITSGGFSIEYDSIVIGEESYFVDPFSGAWEIGAGLFEFLEEDEYLGELNLDLEEVVVELFTLVGVEGLDGYNVYHLKGSLPSESAADLIIETEIWTGVEDSLVRKMAIGFQQTDALSGEKITAQTVITFSDYGESVDIQAPEVEEQDFTFRTEEDDHGDDQASATRIAVSETVEGTIDDLFDYDYFVFQAEEGQTYRIDVALGTLTDSAAGLYDSYQSEEAWNDDYDDAMASQITWTAPDSGKFFVVVEGFDVGTGGSYTLTITQVTAQL